MSRRTQGYRCLMCGYDGRDSKIDRYEDELCPRCDSPSCCYVHSRRYHRYRKLWEQETVVLAAIDYVLLKFLWRMDVRQARDKLRSLYSDRLIQAMEPEQRLSHIKNEMWSFIESGLKDDYGHAPSSLRVPWLEAVERRGSYQRVLGRDTFLRLASRPPSLSTFKQETPEDHQCNYVICINWHQSYIGYRGEWDGCKECAKEFEEYNSDPEGWRERWEERNQGMNLQGKVGDLMFSFDRPTDPSKFDFDYALDIGNSFGLIDYRVHE